MKHICTHSCILCSNDLFLPRAVPMHIPARGRYRSGDHFFSSSVQESEFPDPELRRGSGSNKHERMGSTPRGQFHNSWPHLGLWEGFTEVMDLWVLHRMEHPSQFRQGWIVAEANVGKCKMTVQAGDTSTWLATAQIIGSREVIWLFNCSILNYNYNQHLFQRDFHTLPQIFLTKAPRRRHFNTLVLQIFYGGTNRLGETVTCSRLCN